MTGGVFEVDAEVEVELKRVELSFTHSSRDAGCKEGFFIVDSAGLKEHEGTLGIPAFHAILTDERSKDVPLILETASFERPVEVWGVEIGVLNALSELGQVGEVGAERTKEGGDLEKEMGLLGRRVRDVVGRISGEVEKAKKAKGKEKGTKAVKGAKRWKVSEDADEDEDEGY
ncbi:hypothetical protein DFP72DRAFT_1085300 [Ephemerocybe angulata]|uniref:Uncharacterized protein n=1 Tax=Ephemerocybe angulata TaxID=980116 RepID=A0A8H6H5W1_9AGAR|nr:hypothetical protein DFP72DRAFT_1085300 [Tulosesus angulatus]